MRKIILLLLLSLFLFGFCWATISRSLSMGTIYNRYIIIDDANIFFNPALVENYSNRFLGQGASAAGEGGIFVKTFLPLSAGIYFNRGTMADTIANNRAADINNAPKFPVNFATDNPFDLFFATDLHALKLGLRFHHSGNHEEFNEVDVDTTVTPWTETNSDGNYGVSNLEGTLGLSFKTQVLGLGAWIGFGLPGASCEENTPAGEKYNNKSSSFFIPFGLRFEINLSNALILPYVASYYSSASYKNKYTDTTHATTTIEGSEGIMSFEGGCGIQIPYGEKNIVIGGLGISYNRIKTEPDLPAGVGRRLNPTYNIESHRDLYIPSIHLGAEHYIKTWLVARAGIEQIWNHRLVSEDAEAPVTVNARTDYELYNRTGSVTSFGAGAGIKVSNFDFDVYLTTGVANWNVLGISAGYISATYHFGSSKETPSSSNSTAPAVQ